MKVIERYPAAKLPKELLGENGLTEELLDQMIEEAREDHHRRVAGNR